MILCCGEALIDLIPGQATGERQAFVGGAVLNTSVALGRLGNDVSLVTGLSSDTYGDQIRDVLKDAGVDTSLAVASDRPTTLAIATITDGHARYTFEDETSATRHITPQDLPPVPTDATAGFFGGIVLCNPPVADSLADYAAQFSRHHVVMLDPNIRPGFADDETAYRARLDRMIAVADIIKVSDDDLGWIVPDADETQAVSRLLEAGPSIVVITRGGDGATGFRMRADAVSVATPKITVADTVGAGDTFNAGLLHRLSEQGLLTRTALGSISDDALRDAMDFAARAAAITCSRNGANPPWLHEMG